MGHRSRAGAKRNASVLTTEFAAQIPPLGRRCALHPRRRAAAVGLTCYGKEGAYRRLLSFP